jgi:hypothetical protein
MRRQLTAASKIPSFGVYIIITNTDSDHCQSWQWHGPSDVRVVIPMQLLRPFDSARILGFRALTNALLGKG